MREGERYIFLYLKRVGRPGGVEVVDEREGRQRDREIQRVRDREI